MEKILLLSLLAIAGFSTPESHAIVIHNYRKTPTIVTILGAPRVEIPARRSAMESVFHKITPGIAVRADRAFKTIDFDSVQKSTFTINGYIYHLQQQQSHHPKDQVDLEQVDLITIFDQGVVLSFADNRTDEYLPFVSSLILSRL